MPFSAGPRPRFRRTLHLEQLEDRLTPSWTGVAPNVITPPANATAITLNTLADASGSAAITNDEVDYYTFIAPRSGNYVFSTATPFSSLDTVLGVFSSTGSRLAYNDDIVTYTNTDSRLTISLTAGKRYYFGITNYTAEGGGTYTWTVNGPDGTTAATTSGFQITLSTSGLTSTQLTVFQHAAARWSQVITGDLPNMTYNGVAVDDLLISVRVHSIDGVGGILGQAGPDAFRPTTYLPYHGTMEFDSADMADMQADGSLYYVILHEMGHVLGFGTLWDQKRLLAGEGTSNPRFVGSHAVAAYNQIFGVAATGVPVENTGGAGTRDAHWRESVFKSELMTGWIGPAATDPLSAVTIGSLWDLGYQVNMSAADSFSPSGTSAVVSNTSTTTSGASASLHAARFIPPPCDWGPSAGGWYDSRDNVWHSSRGR